MRVIVLLRHKKRRLQKAERFLSGRNLLGGFASSATRASKISAITFGLPVGLLVDIVVHDYGRVAGKCLAGVDGGVIDATNE